jgi:hypothetical protein
MPARSARAAGGATSLGTLVVAALVPKCPLCVAALLSSVGVGATVAAQLAPVVRPLGFTLAIAALVAAAVVEWRRHCRHAELSGDRDATAATRSAFSLAPPLDASAATSSATDLRPQGCCASGDCA